MKFRVQINWLDFEGQRSRSVTRRSNILSVILLRAEAYCKRFTAYHLPCITVNWTARIPMAATVKLQGFRASSSGIAPRHFVFWYSTLLTYKVRSTGTPTRLQELLHNQFPVRSLRSSTALLAANCTSYKNWTRSTCFAVSAHILYGTCCPTTFDCIKKASPETSLMRIILANHTALTNYIITIIIIAFYYCYCYYYNYY